MGCQPGDFAYGHFNVPPGFVWVCMAQHTHFITPEGGGGGGGGGGGRIMVEHNRVHCVSVHLCSLLDLQICVHYALAHWACLCSKSDACTSKRMHFFIPSSIPNKGMCHTKQKKHILKVHKLGISQIFGCRNRQ